MSAETEDPAGGGADVAPVETVEQLLDLEYEWQFGPQGRQFFQALKEEGRFTGARCPECGSVMVPPVPFCTLCFVEVEDDLVPVEDTGTINMWTEIHIPFPGQGKEPPYIWAFVDLDGADTTLVHILDEADAEDVDVGMRVEAVWKPEEERIGHLTDIRHFKPVDGDGSG